MAKKGKLLELEIGQGRDEEQILMLVEQTSSARQNIEEKLFAAAVAPDSPKRTSTPK